MPVISFVGVVIATIVAVVIGYVWYGPLFGGYWMRLTGKSQGDMRPGPGFYALTILSAFTTALVLSYFIYLTGSASVEGGIAIGILAAVGFVATTQGSAYLAEGMSSRLFGLNLGYHLLNLAIMGAIIGALH